MPYLGYEPSKVAVTVGQGVIDASHIEDASITTADLSNDSVTATKVDDDGTGFQMGSLGLGTAVSGSHKLTVGGTATFSGAITGNLTGNVTGNVTGNTSGTALTVTQAAQSAITSVGTLTSLNITGSTGIGTTSPDATNNQLHVKAVTSGHDAGITLDRGGSKTHIMMNNGTSEGFTVANKLQDAPIRFRVNDGGTEGNALVLSGSDKSGTFGGWVYVDNRVMSSSGDIRVGSNDGNEMLHLLANGTAKIDTAGTTALTIDSSQNATFAENVGIGSSPDSDSLLHVNKDQSAFTRILVENESTSSTSQALLGAKSNAGTINFGITPTQHSFGGDALAWNTANTGFRIATNNTQRFRITNDGYAISNNPSGAKGFIWRYDTDGNYQLALTQDVSSGLVKHTFDLTNAGTAYNDNLVLDRGSVGIGVAPLKQFHLQRTNGAEMRFSANATDLNNNDNLGSIQFSNNNDATGAVIKAAAAGDWATNDYPTDIVFYTIPDGGSDLAERLRIQDDGKSVFTGTVESPLFRTNNTPTSVANGTWTNLNGLTSLSAGLYIVHAYKDGYAANDWSARGIVESTGHSTIDGDFENQSGFQLRVDGANVQLYHTLGNTFGITVSWVKIG